MKTCDTVILGSGFYSFGYALAHPDCIVVEPSQLVDRHYGGTLRGHRQPEYTPTEPLTAELRSLLTEKGALVGERVQVPGLECVLAAFIASHQHLRRGGCLLATEVLGVRAAEGANGENLIDIYNNGGRDVISCCRIIDNRADANGRYLNVECTRTELGAPDVSAAVGGGGEGEGDGITIAVSDAFFDGRMILTLDFGIITDINEAKLMALPCLEHCLAPLGSRVLAMGYRMYGGDRCPTPQGARSVDEYGFSSALAAFDAGVRDASEDKKEREVK